MSKNYDLIATVDIDIASPIVDDTSFDNLLIMGPAPKGEHNAPDVGAYSSIEEVMDAGFVVSGDDADPVGEAALVAFAQSPTPNTVYIAIQKLSASAVAAKENIDEINATIKEFVGTNPDAVGCTTEYDLEARRITVNLTVPFAEASGHGLFEALSALVEKGYKTTIDGATIQTDKQFANTAYHEPCMTLAKGGEPVVFDMKVSTEEVPEVTYRITVAFPDPDVGVVEEDDLAPVDAPETELEDTSLTIARACESSGWYVLCTAGVDPSEYEGIAAFIETQARIFAYTELGFFKAGKDGENAPAVGNVYYRTLGVYGRVASDQPDEEIPTANKYENVAFTAKWLNYSSGSETSAFKALASVYPSELTTTEMKQLEAANLNYFITVGNKNITMNGKVIAGEWADIIRFRDWLKNDMQLRVVNLFIVNPKIPYTDGGIGLVQNQMLASLKAGQDAGGIAEEEFDEDGNKIPGYVTSVPRASSLSDSEKASRKLKRCKFKARLAGAIHFAEITGSLTYSL